MKALNLLLVLGVSSVCACTNVASIEGKWVEPIPGQAPNMQGFELLKGGEARSINMETLKYKKWSVEENKINFTVESIGNGQSFTFDDTYIIKKLDENSLELSNGENSFVYQRQK